MKQGFHLTLAGGLLALPTQLLAGGLLLYEIGTDNTGLANAGSAARAQGPSTIAINPAGMSYLAGTQVSAGAQILFGDLTFNRDSATSAPGSESGNVLDPIPGGSLFISHQLNDQWSVGFGSYGDFGLALDYDNDWSGRYFVQSASIAGLSLVPSVAYRFNEQWSVGVGFKVMYGLLQSEAAIDQSPLGLTARADGQYKFKDGAWGYGANVGVIYAPQAGTRIGLAYTSQISLDFEDRLDVNAGNPIVGRLDGLNSKLGLSVPQTATLSVYQQLDSQWALLASINWQDWSKFGDIGLEVDPSAAGSRSTTLDAHYNDTYQLAVGAQYQMKPDLLWNFGIAYDTSAVSDSNRTLTVPMGAAWRFATGLTYSLNKETDLNFSWVAVWMGDMPIDQQKTLSGEHTSGEFSNAWIQALTGNMTWRF
ncbi:long-chain fatty acid transport protein [Pseudomonas sp. LAMO17WK12:I10]|uniref:OmpP1/FadL family transporter n=1 Tax=unclassified Pseudomonas TaxID=196821 RepID=UPI000BD2E64F|nr:MULTISPECIES: outer membrane protein transport protein [unclassified Pseudomonas]PXX51565.1 long-chain fatty acid transport protein [Pseudomonas sp. LAMO17WK12:I9]SNY53721.1 long-chain fatty acid transport protein [Pseudomonas sp. LAMO17WK12:I10]